MKVKILTVVVLALIISLFVITGCKQKVSQDNAIIVAGNIPLTGPIASFSGQYHKGFEMGVGAATKQFGVAPAVFKMDFQDNAGQPKTAVTVMQKQFMSESPSIYISGTSAMSDAIVGEITKKGIPHFLVSFDAFMTQNNPLAFRVLPNFKIEAPLFLKFIKAKKAQRVFFFTPNLKAYIEQSDKLILPELQKAGIDCQRELFEFEQKEYRSLAAKANKYKPDVIVISGYAFHVYPIIKALREYDLIKKSSVISTLDFIDLIHGDTPREELANIAFTSPECEITGRIPSFASWREEFKKKYGQSASYVDAYAYDTARILVSAYKKSGKVDANSIKAVMPFNGIVGTIDLDQERDLKSTLVIGILKDNNTVVEWKE